MLHGLIEVAIPGATLAGALGLHHFLGGERTARPEPPRLTDYPSVTVIRPIKGLDSEAEENIHAALHLVYPGEVETLFVFDDEHEPALPLVRRALEAWTPPLTHRARVLFCGAPPAHRTGKLHAMLTGLQAAAYERIAFVDSDTRPAPDTLTRLVETLETSPGAGSAFAPVAVTSKPRSLGDIGYALLLNGMYAPLARRAAAQNDGCLSFIMGQFMVFKREALAAIGGLESANGQLVDDMYLGERLNAAGLRNVVAQPLVPIIQHGLSWRAFWGVYVRWITFSRTGLTELSFKGPAIAQGVVFWVALLGLLASPWLGAWAAVMNLLALALVVFDIGHQHEVCGGAPLTWWQMALGATVLLVAPAVYLNVLLSREVNWRGRHYALSKTSHLRFHEV